MDQNPQPPTPSALEQKRKNRIKLALILLIAPTLIGILSGVISVIANYAVAPAPSSDSLFGSADSFESIINIISWVLSAVASITWLPGIVIGIVLLVTKPETQHGVVAQAPQTTNMSQAPAYIQPLSVEQQVELSKRKAKYLTWGLISLILPALLGIIAIITFFLAIANGFAGNTTEAEQIVYPLIFIITGITSFVTFVPGIVIGIILLIKRTQLLPKTQ